MKIPQMFYLRRMKLQVLIAKGQYLEHVVHVYWNYRGTQKGIIPTENRGAAKTAILDKFEDADFWR
jgi:hypothetical protein